MANMRNVRRVFILCITGTMIVLGGCDSMPGHYGQIENYPASNHYRQVDDPVPDETLCTLIIDGTLTLARMGEAGQPWNDGSYGYTTGYSLRITAGERTLAFHYDRSSSVTSGNWIITTESGARGIEVTHEFEPGHTYRVYPIINNAERSVVIGISETSFPVQFGTRIGPYLGWQQGLINAPLAGLFALAQVGFAVPAGDLSMEFLAEANAGIGYSPFKTESSVYIPPENGEDPVAALDFNLQAGGTVNFYFGKSLKKTGLGLGGGVAWGSGGANLVYIPYIRASFFPYEGDFWTHIRLFVDYSFTQEDTWKRLGFGMIFFL
jgi:hypothetical protein